MFVVALICGYSYAIHSRAHYDELDRVLHGIAAHVESELATAPSEQEDVLKASLLLGTGIRLLDRAGRVQGQSQNAVPVPAIDLQRMLSTPYVRPYSPIAALAPALHVVESGGGRFGLLTDAGGYRYRVYLKPRPDSAGYLIATLPLSHLDSTVKGFAQLMFALAFAGGFVAFGAGWIVAQQVLRPVTILTDAAAAISESRQFSQRVADGHGRDELARLARTFNAMLASLQDAYESQVRFVAAASHELRAPLTVIQANLDLLQAAKGSEADRSTAIIEASAESQRMARLVADLLALARADAGVPIRRDPVELDHLVLEVLGEARHLKSGQRLEITDIEPSVVRGDRDQLKQLLLNVIENAIKYTLPGGLIRVAITHRGREAVVSVRDTGVGIGPDDLPRVFERFFRADPARSRDPGGSGLGLSIAQWVATEHGGGIEIASHLGKGTTVLIRLPTT